MRVEKIVGEEEKEKVLRETEKRSEAGMAHIRENKDIAAALKTKTTK